MVVKDGQEKNLYFVQKWLLFFHMGPSEFPSSGITAEGFRGVRDAWVQGGTIRQLAI